MRTQLQKWGNSLALRIPKPFAAEVGLEQKTLVDVTVEEGRIVVIPVAEPLLTLEALLKEVTDENIHHEVDTGPAVGVEAW
ncbi:MAG TPA: AbrB/MazE/SpoVT family DNA-binding domain-containing protein [Syntrophales bacterium]|nr:AbrB/MazE/SpoVT family DNA-binding domain-containing protein [Syntrophales bacterium]